MASGNFQSSRSTFSLSTFLSYFPGVSIWHFISGTLSLCRDKHLGLPAEAITT